MNSSIPYTLAQRGRASVDFMTHIGRGSQGVRAQAAQAVAAATADIDDLPDDLDALNDVLEERLYEDRAFRVEQLLGEWHARRHSLICREAFEEIGDELKPLLASLDEGPASLELNEDATPPAYWDGVAFHRTAGKWDDYEYQGFVHAELIHRRIVDNFFPGGIHKQRAMVAALAPKDHYERILDMGCSTGFFTVALQTTYPNAEIHGVELSRRALEHTRREANQNGWSWILSQRPAEDCGYEDEYFDLVSSYILFHEIPAATIREVFAEAFRVLKPGGDMIMSDVSRYDDLDKVGRWKADRGARYGGEPHWRSSAELDLGEVARQAGFENVVAKAYGPNEYPYVVSGTKPS